MTAIDVEQSAVLDSALNVFRKNGYFDATMDDIAQVAHINLDTLRAQFADKEAMLGALLKAYNPIDEFDEALSSVQDGRAEDMLRDVMRRMTEVAHKHDVYFELVLIDAQVNNGSALTGLSTRLVPKANALLQRMKATGELRPISDLIVARTLISLLMGYVVSERAMPPMARMALRLFPPRAWIDGMVDILIYGLVEDNAR